MSEISWYQHYNGGIDWFMVLGFTALCLVILILILGLLFIIVDGYRWSQAPEFQWPGELVAISHIDSTLQSHAVPVITGNGGVGIGMVSTGHDEDVTTIWNCGKYGRLISHDDTVFQYAQKNSTLRLKKLDGEVRIEGIIEAAL